MVYTGPVPARNHNPVQAARVPVSGYAIRSSKISSHIRLFRLRLLSGAIRRHRFQQVFDGLNFRTHTIESILEPEPCIQTKHSTVFLNGLNNFFPSPMVLVMGFSHQMSLPASAAITDIMPCQWGGVAIWTISMSSLAISSGNHDKRLYCHRPGQWPVPYDSCQHRILQSNGYLHN